MVAVWSSVQVSGVRGCRQYLPLQTLKRVCGACINVSDDDDGRLVTSSSRMLSSHAWAEKSEVVLFLSVVRAIRLLPRSEDSARERLWKKKHRELVESNVNIRGGMRTVCDREWKRLSGF